MQSLPFPIKYNISTESLSLNSGNWWIGTGSVSKGPTSSTGFYNSMQPPVNGYCVYENKASGGPSIRACNNDADLIKVINEISGNNYSTVSQALVYASSTLAIFVDDGKKMPAGVTTEGLVLCMDVSLVSSYPKGDVTWYGISENNYSVNLRNSPTFTNNSYLSFDGVNDYGVFNSEYSFTTGGGTDYTFEIWFKMRTLPTAQYGANGHIWGGENGNDVVMYLNPVSGGVSKGIMVYDDTRYGAPGMQTNGGFKENTWAQWIIVGDGTNNTVTHYINGILDKENGAVTPSSQYAKTWNGTRLAYDARYGTYSSLDLAVIRQYNRQLSATEVNHNYFGTIGDTIETEGLKIALNSTHSVSGNSNGWQFDLAGQYVNLQPWGYTHSDLNDDFNGLTAFTYCLWLKVYSHHTSYSQTPFSKYSGTSTAVIRLYDFGNYNSNNNNGNLTWYLNINGGWGSTGSSYGKTLVGETLFFCIQYDSVTGGQTWVNGEKHGSKRGRTGTVATNSTNFLIQSGESGGYTNTKVKEAYVYDVELSDEKMVALYNSTRAKYGV